MIRFSFLKRLGDVVLAGLALILLLPELCRPQATRSLAILKLTLANPIVERSRSLLRHAKRKKPL